MLLQTIIDDNGTAKREPYFALGGFISTYDNWLKFSDAWQLELDKDPPIKCFKMRHAFHRIGPFSGLKREDIDKRIDRFLEIIKSHAMVRVHSIMKRDDYDRLIKDKVPKEIDHPYFLCFYQILYSIAVFQRRWKWDVQNDFVFDEQGKLGFETIKWLEIVKKIATKETKPYICSTPIFRNDESFLPLQAADLYAWAVRRHLFENKIIVMPKRSELKALQEMQNIERHFEVKECLKFMETKLLSLKNNLLAG